jgi:hypothetical protein
MNTSHSSKTPEEQADYTPPEHAEDYTVPVYLDKNAVYNILGILTGGFSDVEQVSIKKATDETDTNERGGEVGLSNFIRLGFKASKSRQSKNAQETQRNLEKYQTRETLFNTLRLELKKRGLLKQVVNTDLLSNEYVDLEKVKELKPGEFVEVRGALRPSSVVDALSVMVDVIRRESTLSMPSSLLSSPKNENMQESEQGESRLFVVDFVDVRTQRGVAQSSRPEYSGAMMSLLTMNARDCSMAELNHRTFRILGKVINNDMNTVKDGKSHVLMRDTKLDTQINLLVAEMMMQQGKNTCMCEDLAKISELLSFINEQQLALTKPTFYKDIIGEEKVGAPMLELLPIAVYT